MKFWEVKKTQNLLINGSSLDQLPNGERKKYLRKAKQLLDILLSPLDEVIDENIAEDRQLWQEVLKEVELRKNAARQTQQHQHQEA